MKDCNATDLKTLAKNAKKHLKSGFWEVEKERLNKQTKSTLKFGLSSGVFQYVEDLDELYDKLLSVFSSYEVVANPIERIIDKTKYDGYSETEKRQYVNTLITCYRALLAYYQKNLR